MSILQDSDKATAMTLGLIGVGYVTKGVTGALLGAVAGSVATRIVFPQLSTPTANTPKATP